MTEIAVSIAPQFVEWPKIPRLSRECVITEKIDGTNASVFIGDDFKTMLTGSRSGWIDSSRDNYGFARWAEEHRDELLKLGPGHHFGEWWGAGIQRRYGLTEKRFSLFNTKRWTAPDAVLPSCCHLVPVIRAGVFSAQLVDEAIADLQQNGSRAAPGFMKPEGVVVFHVAAQAMFKRTIEKDTEWKGKSA